MLVKRPLLATLVIVGSLDGLMGAVEDRVSLALFGFLLAITGLLWLPWGHRRGYPRH